MDNRKRTFLQIPQGTEGFYLEEAFKHRQLTRHLEKLFYSWGFLPVQTPVFDFFDIYKPLLDSETEEKIYRLIDREGDLLMLRHDITLFLAKQMGLALREEDIPARVCYFDTILRHQNSEDISRNEFFQIGAELIGKTGLNADLEILMLLVESLRLMQLNEVYVHLGSRAVFSACFPDADANTKRRLLALIETRAWEDFLTELSSLDIPADRGEYLVRLFGFIGSRNELSALIEDGRKSGLLKQAEERQLAHLSAIMEELATLETAEIFRVDLSEVGSQPYHSGIVFQAYMVGIDSAIASGGRYDGLLGFFGFDAPSVGFSLLLRKIEDKVGTPERFSPPDSRSVVQEGGFAASYRKAEELRKQGKVVLL